MCAIYDITEKKLYQKRIEQQAYTDFLTGLYNRMCCEKDLAKYVDEARTTGRTGALMYLDLDDFKHINDNLGHQYGDVLLQDISKAMSQIDQGYHDANSHTVGLALHQQPKLPYRTFRRLVEEQGYQRK